MDSRRDIPENVFLKSSFLAKSNQKYIRRLDIEAESREVRDKFRSHTWKFLHCIFALYFTFFCFITRTLCGKDVHSRIIIEAIQSFPSISNARTPSLPNNVAHATASAPAFFILSTAALEVTPPTPIILRSPRPVST